MFHSPFTERWRVLTSNESLILDALLSVCPGDEKEDRRDMRWYTRKLVSEIKITDARNIIIIGLQ